MIAVLVPTLGRPDNLRRVLDDVHASAPENVADVVFIVESVDDPTRAVLDDWRHPYVINHRAPSYAGAINTGLEATTHAHVFLGADDLHFAPNWHEPLLALAAEGYGLIGTNDLHNPDVAAGRHATHYLVTREYAERGSIDDASVFLHEGYRHNYCDTEAVETAQHRGAWAPCLASVVEHRHWLWGHAPMDSTYAKGRDTEPADRALFLSRRHLWT